MSARCVNDSYLDQQILANLGKNPHFKYCVVGIINNLGLFKGIFSSGSLKSNKR